MAVVKEEFFSELYKESIVFSLSGEYLLVLLLFVLENTVTIQMQV